MNDHLPGLLAAMADPAFYPHPVQALQRRDTHASHVFLTGDWVYKIKKPVDFGFLDYSTLAKRKACCAAEVRLNGRLTRGIYRDVVTLTRETGGYALAGDGPVVEVAVRMAQLSDEDTLTRRLAAGRLNPDMIAAVARKLAGFYQAEPPKTLQNHGGWTSVGMNCEENFNQTRAFLGRFIDWDVHHFIRDAARRFLAARRACFERRVARGFIRDCHGDLRCDHVYWGDEIQILDCIEFNPRLRFSDVAADIGFLAMDLDFRGAAELARQLIAAYVAASADYGIYALLDFYKCYRAFVRCKVNCLQLDQIGSGGVSKKGALHLETRAYQDLACRYARAFSRPLLWVFCGLPASGKSTQARGVARALQHPWLRSDVIRKEISGLAPGKSMVVRFGTGLYAPEYTARNYTRLAALARAHLSAGRSVVLDATFGRRAQRRMFRELAASLGVPMVWVVCGVDGETLKRRLAARDQKKGVSDARLTHLDHFKNRWEPLDEIPAADQVAIDTGRPIPQNLGAILARGYVSMGTGLELSGPHHFRSRGPGPGGHRGLRSGSVFPQGGQLI